MTQQPPCDAGVGVTLLAAVFSWLLLKVVLIQMALDKIAPNAVCREIVARVWSWLAWTYGC